MLPSFQPPTIHSTLSSPPRALPPIITRILPVHKLARVALPVLTTPRYTPQRHILVLSERRIQLLLAPFPLRLRASIIPAPVSREVAFVVAPRHFDCRVPVWVWRGGDSAAEAAEEGAGLGSGLYTSEGLVVRHVVLESLTLKVIRRSLQ